MAIGVLLHLHDISIGSIVGEICAPLEQETNMSFVIMSLSNVTVMSNCVFSMDRANTKLFSLPTVYFLPIFWE